jgi:hypothetical protein
LRHRARPPVNNLEHHHPRLNSPRRIKAGAVSPHADITGTVRLNHGKKSRSPTSIREAPRRWVEIRGLRSGLAGQDRLETLRLSAEKVTVDEEFIAGASDRLHTVIDGLKVVGVVNFDFPKALDPRGPRPA